MSNDPIRPTTQEEISVSVQEEMLSELRQCWQEKFGGEADLCAFAPGRVNLIGEHIDYSGGHVMPLAISLGTYGLARRREDKRLRFYSLNFRGIGILEMADGPLLNDPRDHWSNFCKAMLQTLREAGYPFEGGLDLMIYGNIPSGSGLSSSASVELLTGIVIKALWGLEIDSVQLSLLAQKAENQFIGVNCGIMDQFAVAMGRQDHVLLLNTGTLEYDYAPLKLEGCKLVICSSNKHRSLGNSAYNERRRECEKALSDLQKRLKQLKALCQLSPDDFNALQSAIEDPICRQRARHAVYEEARTLAAFEALKGGNLAALGRLMVSSHASLRDLYEVSCRELDFLVDAALEEKTCLGSRMTGGGFGGCTISLVREEGVTDFIEHIGPKYQAEFGYAADFYPVTACEGARVLPL